MLNLYMVQYHFLTINTLQRSTLDFTEGIYTTLENDTINKSTFYDNKTISETIDFLETGYQLPIFWVIWILLIVGMVIGFYYLENKWLD